MSELMSAAPPRPSSSLALIDVHLHVLLPEYAQALIRSGAGDPSRPFRRHDGPALGPGVVYTVLSACGGTAVT